MTVTAASTRISVRSRVSQSPFPCTLACRVSILLICGLPQGESAHERKNSIGNSCFELSALNSRGGGGSTGGDARAPGGEHTHWHIRLALRALARRFLSCRPGPRPGTRVRVARPADDRVERLLLFP